MAGLNLHCGASLSPGAQMELGRVPPARGESITVNFTDLEAQPSCVCVGWRCEGLVMRLKDAFSYCGASLLAQTVKNLPALE